MDPSYLIYFLIAVGLSALLTAVFRRLREDDRQTATFEDGGEFDRRMAELERRFGHIGSLDQNESAGENLNLNKSDIRRPEHTVSTS